MGMRKALMRRTLQIIVLLLLASSLTGCFFNFLQTARTIGAGIPGTAHLFPARARAGFVGVF